jgi:hypothetical protein
VCGCSEGASRSVGVASLIELFVRLWRGCIASQPAFHHLSRSGPRQNPMSDAKVGFAVLAEEWEDMWAGFSWSQLNPLTWTVQDALHPKNIK